MFTRKGHQSHHRSVVHMNQSRLTKLRFEILLSRHSGNTSQNKLKYYYYCYVVTRIIQKATNELRTDHMLMLTGSVLCAFLVVLMRIYMPTPPTRSRQDCLVLSCRRQDCPVFSCRRCEQHWRKVKTVGDRKFRNCFIHS